MKALVAYYSRFGSTRQIAEALAEALRSAASVRLVSADQLAADHLDGADLLVAGTPTHVAKLPKELGAVLDALPDQALDGIHFAAFDTSYKMNWLASLFTAAKPLSRKLRKLGGEQIVPPQSFHVVEREGPLHEGEVERARAWAETIQARMRTASSRGHVRLW